MRKQTYLRRNSVHIVWPKVSQVTADSRCSLCCRPIVCQGQPVSLGALGGTLISAASQPHQTSPHTTTHEQYLQRVRLPSLLLCTSQRGLGDWPDSGTAGQHAPSPASPLLRQMQTELRGSAPQPGCLPAHPHAKLNPSKCSMRAFAYIRGGTQTCFPKNGRVLPNATWAAAYNQGGRSKTYIFCAITYCKVKVSPPAPSTSRTDREDKDSKMFLLCLHSVFFRFPC